MSTHFKTSLLAASAMIAAAATPAHAQLVYPKAELHAAGATSIQDILPREANCIGDYNADSSNNNSFNVPSGTTAFAARSAVTTAGSTAKFNCATQNIQPNLTLKYLAVGSTGGRNGLVAVPGSASRTAILGTNTKPDATIFGTDTDTWTMTHFVMSDAPMTTGNDTSWNTNKPTGAGALIQIPLFVLPIAVTYNPIYGYKKDGSNAYTIPLTFNIKAPNGLLRLSKHAYCGIFNGNIKNWNHAEITRSNTPDVAFKKTGQVAGTPLFDATNDGSARWTAEGAPIRLVGRLDGSGTTDIFTRHLSVACQGPIIQLTGTAKITRAAEQLPYNVASAINMTSGTGSLSSANYKPSQTDSTKFAGDATLISGAAYAGTSGIVTVSGTGEVITANASGTNGSGLYILANGGGNVASAVVDARDNPGVLIASADASIKFNGKIGYVSADTVFTNPTPVSGNSIGGTADMVLKTAALEVGTSYNKGAGKKWDFAQPNAANATLAFGGVLPPESDSKGGYVAGGDLLRSNPLNWYDALYANLSTLANPVKGYPMTGTSQLITGTCFADPATRNGLATLLNTLYGANITGSDGKKFDKTLFTGAKAGALGIRQQQGLAQLPAAWINAIKDTFLARNAKFPALYTSPLYIQNGLVTEKYKAPTKVAKGSALSVADLTAIVPGTTFPLGSANPTCTAGQGIPTL